MWIPRVRSQATRSAFFATALAFLGAQVCFAGGGVWHFDEGEGTVAIDSSGAGNTGEIHDATYVPGVRGTALHFDAGESFSRVVLPDSVFNDFGATFYVEAWVRPQSYSRSGNPACETEIVRKRAPYNDWIITLLGDGSLACSLWPGPGGQAGLVPLGEWTKVACGADETSIYIWVNDQEIGTFSQPGGVDWYLNYLETQIGNDTHDWGINCGDYGFQGDIDEVRILGAIPACRFDPAPATVFTRSPGRPRLESTSFNSCGGARQMAVAVSGSAVGTVLLNGQTIVRPRDFGGSPDLIERSVVLLQGQNVLSARLTGAPGSSITVEFIEPSNSRAAGDLFASGE